MKENTDPLRNRPSENGGHNDPNIRDESALRPGTETISDSASDDVNNHVTKTASDSFRTKKNDNRSDTTFDEVGDDES